jgi:hypothetical protein
MKKRVFTVFLLLAAVSAVIVLGACGGTPEAAAEEESTPEAAIALRPGMRPSSRNPAPVDPAPRRPARTESAPAPEPAPAAPAKADPAPAAPAAPVPRSPWFDGDGGRGMSLAILAPQGKGLAADQGYLPALVQGELVSNFSGYSAISVLDRVNLDTVIGETLSGYYADDAEGVIRLGHITNTDYVMTGAVTKTSSGYSLQAQIAATSDGMTRASWSGTCTIAELDNFTGVRRASAGLLEKMGVQLTAKAKEELAGAAAEAAVSAQTALAKGITAQRGGTVVEALSCYYEAAKFDPSLAEAASRGSVLSASIQGGSIGANVRNDIQARNAWIKTLEEAAAFFKAHPPFEIVYDPTLAQGSVDYAKETVNLSFEVILIGTTGFKVISDLEQGLEKTGKTRDGDIPGHTGAVCHYRGPDQ